MAVSLPQSNDVRQILPADAQMLGRLLAVVQALPRYSSCNIALGRSGGLGGKQVGGAVWLHSLRLNHWFARFVCTAGRYCILYKCGGGSRSDICCVGRALAPCWCSGRFVGGGSDTGGQTRLWLVPVQRHPKIRGSSRLARYRECWQWCVGL